MPPADEPDDRSPALRCPTCGSPIAQGGDGCPDSWHGPPATLDALGLARLRRMMDHAANLDDITVIRREVVQALAATYDDCPGNEAFGRRVDAVMEIIESLLTRIALDSLDRHTRPATEPDVHTGEAPS